MHLQTAVLAGKGYWANNGTKADRVSDEKSTLHETIPFGAEEE